MPAAAEELPQLRPEQVRALSSKLCPAGLSRVGCQVVEIEEELLKAGGSERFRRLSLHLGVQERQVPRDAANAEGVRCKALRSARYRPTFGFTKIKGNFSSAI